MHHGRIGSLLPACLTLACSCGGLTTAPTDARPADDPARSGNAKLPSLPIIAVPQRAIPLDVREWSFDPQGRFVASPFYDEDTSLSGCGIWEIESGAFVHELVDVDTDPCVEWRALPTARSIHADVLGAELKLQLEDGSTRTVEHGIDSVTSSTPPATRFTSRIRTRATGAPTRSPSGWTVTRSSARVRPAPCSPSDGKPSWPSPPRRSTARRCSRSRRSAAEPPARSRRSELQTARPSPTGRSASRTGPSASRARSHAATTASCSMSRRP